MATYMLITYLTLIGKTLFIIVKHLYFLSHTVYSPKHIQNNQGTLISNILVDNSRLNSSIVLPTASVLYDHDAEGKCYITHKTRLINNNTITNFQDLLNNETWESKWWCLWCFQWILELFLIVVVPSFPVKYTNFNVRKNGWITQGIGVSCSHKRNLCALSEKCTLRILNILCHILYNFVEDVQRG